MDTGLSNAIMKEVTRYNDGMGLTRRQLVDNILVLLSQSRATTPPETPAAAMRAAEEIADVFGRVPLPNSRTEIVERVAAIITRAAVPVGQEYQRGHEAAWAEMEASRKVAREIHATTSPETPVGGEAKCIYCGHSVDEFNAVTGRYEFDHEPDNACLGFCDCKCEFAAAVQAAGDDEAERRAIAIVGTVFDNTAASPETLKQTMIERVAAALRSGEGEGK